MILKIVQNKLETNSIWIKLGHINLIILSKNRLISIGSYWLKVWKKVILILKNRLLKFYKLWLFTKSLMITELKILTKLLKELTTIMPRMKSKLDFWAHSVDLHTKLHITLTKSIIYLFLDYSFYHFNCSHTQSWFLFSKNYSTKSLIIWE